MVAIKSSAEIIFSIPFIQIYLLTKNCVISLLSTLLYHGYYNSERKKNLLFPRFFFPLREEFKLKVYSTEVLLCMQVSLIACYDSVKR